MFKVNAGYSKDHIGKNFYYVIANSKSEAETIFKSFVSWLTVYSIEECGEDKKHEVLTHQGKFCIL